MSCRDDWQRVLDAEVKRWSALPWERLIADLKELAVYEVEVENRRYQVEVELLENTEQSVQVMVAVDDGTLPASLQPATNIFVRHKVV